ncbi:MAG: hypothetical protein HY800_07200, partial [Ignavibacteriales bacterium]|nr:hypothetical protein [Ignavibacteriales bacterium]
MALKRSTNVKIQGTSNVLSDGDGTATIENQSGGTFDGSTIFPPNTGSLTTRINITGTSAGLLDTVRLTVPTDFTGFSGTNVTLGDAFSSKTKNVVGNQITIPDAALGTTAGTITITSLTSPNPVGAQQNGNSTWKVETADSGGILTEIVSSPKSHTLIPISNLRTGGTDGYGNSDADGDTSAMNGQVVAVAGIATVENGVMNTTFYTSFFIQSGGYGMQIFNSSTPTSFARGDSIIVKGTIVSYNGGMEVSPPSSASPNFFVIGAGTLPTPINITFASEVNEAHEGLLVRLQTKASFDSAGQTFVASAANRGRNNFRTSPTDTGTVFLHYANTNVVGKTIPDSAIIVGIVHQRNDYMGVGQSARKLAVRDVVDIGMDPADGTGYATITPANLYPSAFGVAETLNVRGNGTHTIKGMSVTIPSTWTWTDTSSKALSGPGLTGAIYDVSGDGSVGDPYVLTLFGTTITNTDTVLIILSNLNAPSSVGLTTFTVKTKGATGSLSNIAVSPTVNIMGGFEAVATGNWNSNSTWSGNVVPGA